MLGIKLLGILQSLAGEEVLCAMITREEENRIFWMKQVESCCNEATPVSSLDASVEHSACEDTIGHMIMYLSSCVSMVFLCPLCDVLSIRGEL